MTDRPLLLLDIDGVLNPFVPVADPIPNGFSALDIDGMRVLLTLQHGSWLHDLTAAYEIVWASTWEADANRLIGAVIGAPELPFLTFTERDPQDWTWKLPAVQRFAGDRRVAWLDDDPGHGAAEWAATRSVPTLLVQPDRRIGWTRAEYDRLVEFAEGG